MSTITSQQISKMIFKLIFLACITMDQLQQFVIGSRNDSNITFSRHHIEILFNPFDNDKSDSSTSQNLQLMLSQVSTKFTKLSSPPITPRQRKSSLALIPTAVARYNSKLTSSQTSLQLSMEFSRHIYDAEMGNGTSLDLILSLANKANEIYKGAVQVLLLHYGGLNEDAGCTPRDAFDETLSSVAKTKGAKFNHDLGAIFSIVDCKELAESNDLIPIMDKLTSVQFTKWAEQKHYAMGVEVALLEFYREFENCIVNVRKVNTKIKIGFRTRWADSSLSGEQSIGALVYFWEEIAEWAKRRNTTLVFHEAFDQPSKRARLGGTTFGWWRVGLNQASKSEKNYVLIEKASLLGSTPLVQIPKEDQNPTQIGGASVLWVTIVVPTVAGLVVIITAVLAYGYKKKLNEVENSLLSKHELDEFYNGRQGSFDYENGIDPMDGMAYNTDYEVYPRQFKIEMSSKLGSGQFGLIRKGTLRGVDVAVKMGNPYAPSLVTLKGMLSEIKVLSYLGKHEHIVGLLGAFTTELHEGRVFLFLELCTKGSLERRLRRYDDIISGKRGVSNVDNVRYSRHPSLLEYERVWEDEVNLTELLRWSYEIVSGMEYLSSMHVLHADLATRNVLLTENLVCKVCDFGLSRRLYDYSNYVRTQQEPLPWRWLAPEALRRMQFSEKTDVWAFGVTLWEIFSLGVLPYPGHSWTADFVQDLEGGMRMSEPKYKRPGIYPVMQSCWEFDPDSRPNFAELKEVLRAQVDAQTCGEYLIVSDPESSPNELRKTGD